MPRLFALALLLIFKNLSAQTAGCTDPQAQNFDPAASQNDGSCQYPPTNFALKNLAQLPAELREASGLTLAGGKFWSMSDNFTGKVAVYQLDPATGAKLQEVELQDATRRDWEALATDSSHLFIGDFGNNSSGNRTDLGIYKLPLDAIGSGTAVVVVPSDWHFLPFKFADQTDFSPKSNVDSIEHDCEAMIFFNGKHHLFSKNWKRRTTTHYLLETGGDTAQPLETFDSQGVITDAAISPDQKLIALLGYNKSSPFDAFVWLLWDFHDGSFFNGNRRKLSLGSFATVGQVEGIAFSSNRTGFVVNERVLVGGVTLVPAQVWSFDFSQFLTGQVSAGEAISTAPKFSVFPNPFFQTVDFQFFRNEKPDFVRVRDGLGRQVFFEKNCPQQISTAGWAAGRYIFEASFRGKISTFAAVKM